MGSPTYSQLSPTPPMLSRPLRPRQDMPIRYPDNRTASDHTHAVSQVITLMREQLDAPHRLRDIARTALMSPFHFHRIFRLTTTTTPGRFLTALRMSEAKRMLLETTLSSTQISILVGYSSFGTFTTQFTKLVGIPPGRYRRFAQPMADTRLTDLFAQPAAAAGVGTAYGWVSARPDGSPGLAIVALYSSEIAAALPLACAVTPVPGPVRLRVPDRAGAYSILAASVDPDARLGAVLAGTACAGMYVGATRLTPAPDEWNGPASPFTIRLRTPQLTDPPLLTAFPLLLDFYHDHVPRPDTAIPTASHGADPDAGRVLCQDTACESRHQPATSAAAGAGPDGP